MFLQFFTSLRDAQVPVTLREYLTLMEALDANLAMEVEIFTIFAAPRGEGRERTSTGARCLHGDKGMESCSSMVRRADIPRG